MLSIANGCENVTAIEKLEYIQKLREAVFTSPQKLPKGICFSLSIDADVLLPGI